MSVTSSTFAFETRLLAAVQTRAIARRKRARYFFVHDLTQSGMTKIEEKPQASGFCISSGFSSVALTHHEVQAAENRDHITHHMAGKNLRKNAQVHEGRGPNL